MFTKAAEARQHKQSGKSLVFSRKLDTQTQIRSDQIRSDQTRPDQTRPDQTRPDQTRPGQDRTGQDRTGQDRTDRDRLEAKRSEKSKHAAKSRPQLRLRSELHHQHEEPHSRIVQLRHEGSHGRVHLPLPQLMPHSHARTRTHAHTHTHIHRASNSNVFPKGVLMCATAACSRNIGTDVRYRSG